MILNELLTKQSFITNVILKDGEKELSKELKIKIMRVRMAYSKVRKQFEEDIQEFTKEIVPEELQKLASKDEKTEEENKKMQELNDKVNQEYKEFIYQKGLEEIKSSIEDKFTEDEYAEIIDINSEKEVEINGTKLNAPDFLEIFYSLFVA